MKSVIRFATLMCAIFLAAIFAQAGIIEGEIQLMKVEVDSSKVKSPTALKAKAFKLSFPVFQGPDGLGFYTLMAPPLGTVPGEYEAVTFEEKEKLGTFKVVAEGRQNAETQEILDAPELDVLPKNSKVVKRAAEEDAEQKAIFTKVTPERYWNAPFVKPLDAPISSHFGIYRMYSKHLRRRTHWGVDFRTPVGTPVVASSDGIVVLAKELFFPGKMILIDHGFGLYTGYSHLSHMNVKVGDKIKGGQLIGKSGISGKVTGPHLHWLAVNARVKFDPLKLLDVNFPGGVK